MNLYYYYNTMRGYYVFFKDKLQICLYSVEEKVERVLKRDSSFPEIK